MKAQGVPSPLDPVRPHRHPLDAIFAPRNIAVIGATERANSVGRTVFWNLISNPFGGTVFPVNPRRRSVLDIKAYPNVAAVPEHVDLAVVITPAPTVPGIIGECLAAGVEGAIIISSGFRELGPPGVELERQILEQARRGKMRIIGPNCLGVMNPSNGLNATFAGMMARPGNVGFISQSGALCTAILDWSHREMVGFSAFLSIGSMLDVGWGDLIEYFGDDPRTHSIILYMESIGNARAFLSAAREVALTKPLIVIKAGRSEAAARAAASHTGALAGSDEVLDAAFRRAGVLRVSSIADLFSMADVLAKQPRPKGPRLTILTNAGGPGVLATDSLVSSGGELTNLAPETLQALNDFLPPPWSHGNPIDILGDAGPERYARALQIATGDPNGDGLLVILTPQEMTNPTQTAEQLRPYATGLGKPVLASWMGGGRVRAGEDVLNSAGIPTFAYPDAAARAFTYMWRYTYNLRGIYETPVFAAQDGDEKLPDRTTARQIIQGVRRAGRTILTEVESKQLLAAYGIPTVETRVARTAAEAIRLAEPIGYPVVLKLYSETITHKTEVRGVQLNLADPAAVERAFRAIEASVCERAGAEYFQGVAVEPMVRMEGYELIIGSTLDAQFGPVLLFGSGGQLVEVYRDRALALPPLTTTLARRLMEQTRIYTALQGVRGRPPVDLAGLEMILVRFSQLVVEQPWIKESDVNPLLASPDRLLALDARFVLHDPQAAEETLPRPAIRPYPIQYRISTILKDGTPAIIRPIRPEDEPLLAKFHQNLSERSVRFRYFHPMKLGQRVSHERLLRVCFNDYDCELGLVAEHRDPATGQPEILGIGRLSKLHNSNRGEFALLVADQWQQRGLGKQLLTLLLQFARDEKLSGVTGDILNANVEMRRLCEKLGFELGGPLGESSMKAEIAL